MVMALSSLMRLSLELLKQCLHRLRPLEKPVMDVLMREAMVVLESDDLIGPLLQASLITVTILVMLF